MNLTLFVIIAVSVFNGMASVDALRFAAAIISVTWPLEFLPREPSWLLYQASIVVSSATLLVSGIPAALYERIFRPVADNATSMYIWLAGAAVLTIPALQAAKII